MYLALLTKSTRELTNLNSNSDYMQQKLPILTPSQLKQMQIMQITITAGPSLAFFTALVLYFSASGITEMATNKSALLIILTAAHFATLGLLFPVSLLLPVRFLSRFKKTRGDVASGKLVAAAHNIRLILMVIPAFFGLSIIILAISKGILYEEPLYWANVASYFILVAQTFLQFPNQQRTEFWYGGSFKVE
jgi:hypothetical protein